MEVSGQLHAPTALSPGKEPPVPIGKEAGWTSEYRYDVEKEILDPTELRALCFPTLGGYTDSR
jgi:hypothetical protein